MEQKINDTEAIRYCHLLAPMTMPNGIPENHQVIKVGSSGNLYQRLSHYECHSPTLMSFIAVSLGGNDHEQKIIELWAEFLLNPHRENGSACLTNFSNRYCKPESMTG